MIIVVSRPFYRRLYIVQMVAGRVLYVAGGKIRDFQPTPATRDH